jgi:TPR repeat protein
MPRPNANAARRADDTFNLGLRLYHGDGVAKNLAEAAWLFRSIADQGHPDAQHHYGMMLYKGDGVVLQEQAAHYFQLAANQGHAGAQNSIGVCFANGKGVPQNHGEAARYHRLAVDQGHAGAQTHLGMLLCKGEGMPQDYGEASQMFRLAADQGHAGAQHLFGDCYLKGEGVAQDDGEAVRYYRLASDQGCPRAQLMLGRMLVGDVPVDESVPVDLLAGAKLLARVAQCALHRYNTLRPQALDTLRKHNTQREVVWACCLGCGATHGLERCQKCHAARFCGSACMRQMWPAHKRCCARWAEQRDDAPQ